jgi:photosystem II stability/assembly factor-like uncharacterized protein
MLVAAGLFVLNPAEGSDPAWEQLGPESGGILAIAISPHSDDVVYAGTSSGVFKSSDGGHSWNFSGLAGEGVLALAVDPTTATRIYAGTDTLRPGTGGVFVSTDGGDSWSEARSGLEDPSYPETSPNFRYLPVTSLLIDQQDSNTVWAGTGENDGLFKSSDGGATWSWARFDDDIETLAADPNGAGVFFASLHGLGPYRSRDAGISWWPVGTDMVRHNNSGRPYYPTVYHFAISPADPQIVYASTSDELFKSSNGGDDWQSLGGFPSTLMSTASLRGVVADPYDSDAAYVATWFDGVFRTRDGGASWEQIGEGLECESSVSDTTFRMAAAFAISPVSSRLFLGTQSEGMFVRTVAGDTWEKSNTGLFATEVFSVAANPRNSAQLIATVRELGLQKSFDGGKSWETANNGNWETCRRPNLIPWSGPIPDCFVNHSVEWLDEENAIIVAGECGMLVSRDEGNTWDDLGSPGDWVDAIAVAPGDTQRVYVVLGSPRKKIERSLDGGLTWSRCAENPIDNGSFYSLAVSPEDASTVIAGTAYGLYTSHDGCASWFVPAPDSNARCPDSQSTVVYAIEYAPHRRGLVYAGTSCGVFASHDGGNHWHHLGLEGLNISVLTFGRGEILSGTWGDGVWASNDSGATWTRISDDDDNPYINDILVDPTTRKLYVSSAGNGVAVLDRSPPEPRRPTRRAPTTRPDGKSLDVRE